MAFTTIGKYLTQEMSVPMITFFRCIFGLFFIAPWIFRAGISGLVTQRPILLISRGINTLLGLYCVFAAVSLIPVADVVAIMYSKPIFASIAALLILREAIYSQRWLAIFIGFGGMLLIIQPVFREWNFGILYALGAMGAGAFTTISVKLMTKTEPPDRIVAYTLIVMTIGSFIPALFLWETPNSEQILWLILLGGLATAFQRCTARAYASADATVVLPFEFARLVIAAIFGFYLFNQLIDLWIWVGGTVIFLTGVYIVRIETKRDLL